VIIIAVIQFGFSFKKLLLPRKFRYKEVHVSVMHTSVIYLHVKILYWTRIIVMHF